MADVERSPLRYWRSRWAAQLPRGHGFKYLSDLKPHRAALIKALELQAGKARAALGPIYTSNVCSDIHLKLTSATYRTYARACLETANGSSVTSCGDWVFLSYSDTWDTLYRDAPGDSRWQLQMYGDAAESVTFFYTAWLRQRNSRTSKFSSSSGLVARTYNWSGAARTPTPTSTITPARPTPVDSIPEEAHPTDEPGAPKPPDATV